MRRRLPDRRAAETYSLTSNGKAYTVTAGYHPDGSLGELFISGAKAGTEMDAIARDGSVLLSLALQHGVSLETIAHALTRENDGSAASIVGAVTDELVGR